ncbi:MAG: PBP1A family penicillin-binding protein [Acetobacteraceae bacterium]|nr:PBP1A family penicillin-binding protein [Acetobacteraceae bacterium]
MSDPLTAGERLASPAGSGGPDRGRTSRKAAKPRRSPLRWLGRLAGAIMGFVFLAVVLGGVAGYSAYRHFAADLPDVEGLRSYQPRIMSRVYAGDARPIAELATERRIFVPYQSIPLVVKNAFVAAEDQNFWQHRGVDVLAIARASFTNLQQLGQGRRPIGASTITQQVAKNMLLGNEVSLARKAKEAILALRIEETLSKERILELYLNEIYLGLQSYGVAAAAQAYFNKPLDELSLPEAAFLAALPKAPNNYNPFRFPEAAKVRRDWVLDRMTEVRAIDAADAAAAKAAPVVPAQFHRPDPVPGADWFAEEVRRRLVDQFGADATTQGGLMVRTSFDAGLQAAADKALHDGLVAYDRKLGGWRGPAGHLDLNGAALRTGWASALAHTQKPPGIRPEWRLAVVTEETDREARVGWLEHPEGPPGTPPLQRVGALSLADLGWARPIRDGRMVGPPRRMADIAQAGDLVMIEPAAAAVPEKARPAVEHVTLRQIPAVQGALVSMDPMTGRVFAMVGGWSFEQSQFNRATQALRQPGSSFKPMVYLTAMEQGMSPSWRFQDAPISIGDWHPNNYEMTFSGPTSLHTALEKSLNLVTLRVAQRLGMEAVAQTAMAFHVVDNMPRVLPAALGAVDTTVLRMAGAYASLAQGGKEVVPTLIDSVQDRDGHVVSRDQSHECGACADPSAPPEMGDARRQIADPESVFQIVTMMQAVVQHGTGTEAGKGLNRPIAGKTGTTQDFNDAWFVGFTPDLVTAVWIGYDTPSSLGDDETGGHVAAPIWHNFMTSALKDRPVLTFAMPPGMTMARWDGNLDAFKPGQVPGTWGPGGGGGDEGGLTAAAPGAGGVDNSMGGLY